MVKRTIEVSIIGKDKLSSSLDSIAKGALRRIGEELTMFARRLPAAAVEMVKLGATAERQSNALNNLAASFGQSGDEIVASIQRASDMTIDRMTAMQAANKAMLLGVAKTPKEFERITRTAVALGRAMGQNAAKSIDDFVVAAGRQSIMIADNLGLIIRQKDLQDDVNRILKETPGITEAAAKSQAFLNAMLESGEEKMGALGTSGGDTATEIERLDVALKDLKTTAGELAAEAAKPALGMLNLGVQASTLDLKIRSLQKEMLKLGQITDEDVQAFALATAEQKRQIQSTENMTNRVEFLNKELERLGAIQLDRKIAFAEINTLMREGVGIIDRAVEARAELEKIEKAEAKARREANLEQLTAIRVAETGIEVLARQQSETDRFAQALVRLGQETQASRRDMLALAESQDVLTASRERWAQLQRADLEEGILAQMTSESDRFAQAIGRMRKATEIARDRQLDLADATAHAAEETEAAAAVTGDEFVQAVGDATDGTDNWAIALLEAADAAGADANELAILAGSLGIYTDEQIAAALATVALTATIDTLGQAIADGSITIDEAISVVQEAVDALKIDISLTQRSTAATGRSTTATRQNTKAKRDATRAARELAREQARSGDLFIDAIGNMEIATEAADQWAIKLLEAADAAGADAAELALLGGALGLFTDEQIEAALAIAAMEAAIANLGAKIAAGMKIDKAIREFNRLREALQLPAWMQPGSPTPLELGLLGIADAMRQVSAVELPRLQSSLGGAGAPGGNRMVTNNFMLTTNTQAAASMVRQDFQTMQAMAG